MSLKTNAKKTISFYILVASLALIGLVGYMSFNSPNIVANAYDYSEYSFNYMNYPDFNYSNYEIYNSSPRARYLNANIDLTITPNKIVGGAITLNNNWINTPFHNKLAIGISGVEGDSFITFLSPIPIVSNSKLVYSTCGKTTAYRPSIYIDWYDTNKNIIEGSAVYASASKYNVNYKWEPEILDFSALMPSNAVYFTFSIELDNDGINSPVFIMPIFYHNTSLANIDFKDNDYKNLLDMYQIKLDTETYYYSRYTESQENLRLAQEEGATVVGVLESITTAPINAIAQFMEFELPFFNINLGSILAIIITLMLVGFAIKILMSKG